MGWCHFLTGCVLFMLCSRGKIKSVYVVPVGICLFVVVKKENPTASRSCNNRMYLFVCRGEKGKPYYVMKASAVVRFKCEIHTHGVCRHLHLVPVLGP